MSIDSISIIGTAFFIVHEMDAVFHKEWKMYYSISLLKSEIGYRDMVAPAVGIEKIREYFMQNV